MMMAESVELGWQASNEHEGASSAECPDEYQKERHPFSHFACYTTNRMRQIPPSSLRD
jgi:hypothetical protein